MIEESFEVLLMKYIWKACPYFWESVLYMETEAIVSAAASIQAFVPLMEVANIIKSFRSDW